MSKSWNIRRWVGLAVAGCALAISPPAFAAETDAQALREKDRLEAQDAKRGRSVVFRAGELPRVPRRAAPPTRKAALPTHFLDTTLPILLQGAPHELVLRRYVSTS